MSYIVDTVEDRIQTAVLTAKDSIVARKIELAISSKMRPLDGMRPVSQQIRNVENIQGLVPLFETVSEMIHTLHVLNTNDEIRNKIPDDVSELSVPDTYFDRQPHTHHNSQILIQKRNSWIQKFSIAVNVDIQSMTVPIYQKKRLFFNCASRSV